MNPLNIVYKSKNDQRKCFYIGKSVYGLNNRQRTHKHSCFTRQENNKFYNFLRKYGWKSFDWEVLAVYPTKEELPQAEIDWLKKQKEELVGWECLNLTEGGDGLLGYKPSEITKEKQRNALKKRIIKEETRKKLKESAKKRVGEKASNFGKSHSKEWNEKIKKSLIGKSHSEETKQKQRESRKRYFENIRRLKNAR